MAELKCVMRGLEIISRHTEEVEVFAEHDELFSGGPEPSKLSEDEKRELAELGWRYSNEDVWAIFT